MKPNRLYPLVSTLAASCVLALALAPSARASDNILHDMAIEFFTQEFVPTLLALASAALREPMTWGVIAAGFAPALLRRARVGKSGVRQAQARAASAPCIDAGARKP
jgi:hypothetical protein